MTDDGSGDDVAKRMVMMCSLDEHDDWRIGIRTMPISCKATVKRSNKLVDPTVPWWPELRIYHRDNLRSIT